MGERKLAWHSPSLGGVERLIRSALQPPPESSVTELYDWLNYQVGWSTLDGAPASGRRGKGVRPSLCLVACAAAGGPIERAEPAAAAIELTHEFSLIHDDLQDRDETRRGRPALWTAIGDAQAITAGDALFGIARLLLSGAKGAPADSRLDVVARYDRACIRLAEGQYLDISFEDRHDVTLEEYLEMVACKTGALLGVAAGIGARLGGSDARTADDLESAGEAIGIAFQIRDDILGLWGAGEKTGKPAGNDLRRGKKSLPILFALDEPSTRSAVTAYWDAGAPDGSTLALLDLIDQVGARQYAEDQAEHYANRAIHALEALPLRAAPIRSIIDLASAAVHRDV